MKKDVELPRIFKLVFAFLILIGGLALYLFWAASYDAWADIGLYAVVTPIVGFGLAGIFLFTRKEPEEE